MQTLKLETLASNAWRTLGLPATASQADVDQAARNVHLARSDPHPPHRLGFSELGPLARTGNDLAQAVSRLNEPESRVRERLLWFHTPAAAGWGTGTMEALDRRCGAWAESPDPAARHDAALAALHAAMVLDSDVSDESRWRRAIVGFTKLAEADDYRQWLHRAESEGDFEKRAEPDEIDLAIRALPDSIAASLVGRANEAMDDGDVDRCGRIFRLLFAIGNAELQTNVLDRIEDALDRNCRLLHDEVGRQLKCEHARFQENKAFNYKVASEHAKFYNKTISPLQTLAQTGSQTVNDHDRGIRSRDMAANALAKVALSWVWAGKYVGADQTYDAALRLAAGNALSASIRADKAENAGRAASERAGAFSNRANTPASRENKGWKVAGWLIVMVIMAAFRSGSTKRSTPSYVPERYHYELPRMPETDPDYLRNLQRLAPRDNRIYPGWPSYPATRPSYPMFPDRPIDVKLRPQPKETDSEAPASRPAEGDELTR